MMVEEGMVYDCQQRACSKSTDIVPETTDKGRSERGDSASERSDSASLRSFKIPCNWPMQIEDPDKLKEDRLKEDEGKEDEWKKQIEGLEK